MSIARRNFNKQDGYRYIIHIFDAIYPFPTDDIGLVN